MEKKLWGFLSTLGCRSLRHFHTLCASWASGSRSGCSIGSAVNGSPKDLSTKYCRGMLPLLFTTVLVLLPLPSFGQGFSAQYDEHIQYSVDRFWGDIFPYPWAWKAQLYQESRLNPHAVSPVGAKGLAQFMPGTWAQETKNLGWGNVSPFSPKHSVMAGAYYMRKLSLQWSSKRTVLDRHWLAQASYNAGLGNILKAQKLCNGALSYHQIIRCLPRVTGPTFSHETITYTVRINKWWSVMAPGPRFGAKVME